MNEAWSVYYKWITYNTIKRGAGLLRDTLTTSYKLIEISKIEEREKQATQIIERRKRAWVVNHNRAQLPDN